MESVHLAALDQINPQPLPAISQDAGIIDWAHNIVQAEPDIEPLASLLLGRVALAENKQAAYAFALDAPPGCLAVAPDGFSRTAAVGRDSPAGCRKQYPRPRTGMARCRGKI